MSSPAIDTPSAAQPYIEALIKEAAQGQSLSFTANDAEALPAFQTILALEPALKKAILLQVSRSQALDPAAKISDPIAIMTALLKDVRGLTYQLSVGNALSRLRSRLSQTQLDFAPQEFTQIVQDIAQPISRGHRISNEHIFLRPLILYAQTAPLPDETKTQLTLLAGHIQANIQKKLQRAKDAQPILDSIDSLLGTTAPSDTIPLKPGDAWADLALTHLESLTTPQRTKWASLLEHAKSQKTNRPSNAWRKKAVALIKDIGDDTFSAAAIQWLQALDLPRSAPIPAIDYYDQGSREEHIAGHLTPDLAAKLLDPDNSLILRGIVFAAGALKRSDLTRAIGSAIISAYIKIPNFGCRSGIVGNACIIALSDDATPEGLVQLDIARNKVKYVQAQKLLYKAFNDAAAVLGITQEQMADMIVPTYNLDSQGKTTIEFGSARCTFQVDASETISFGWTLDSGKTQASIPAQVKTDHAARLKDLTKTAKEAQSILRIQKSRLESTYLTGRSWSFPEWKKYIAGHPLVGTLASRLVWFFLPDQPGVTGFSAIVREGTLIDSSGNGVSPADDSTVKLWHPLFEPPASALAWRRWIESQQIVQPFKQAHREVYLLTDAETRTHNYSNRFAAHIIRQHQFKALCDARGWGFDLHIQSADTGAGNAIKPLPVHGLVAEYWVQPIATGTGPSGVFLHLATDQVRFYQVNDRNTPLPLASIPPLVLSEVMRDVDLFVGVSSVANDPNWTDSGSDQRYTNYWHDYSFGDLSASAITRRELLQTIVPRLKIAQVCSFEDKWLIVKGKLHTYKIHLGSGNIQMQPNNQYLCIVPSAAAGKTAGSIYLPFEGDSTLSVIISKAIMLAADDKITDTSITRQIRQ